MVTSSVFQLDFVRFIYFFVPVIMVTDLIVFLFNILFALNGLFCIRCAIKHYLILFVVGVHHSYMRPSLALLSRKVVVHYFIYIFVCVLCVPCRICLVTSLNVPVGFVLVYIIILLCSSSNGD